MYAYDKDYLSGAMDGFGTMVDFAVRCRGLAPGAFYDRFLSSGIDGEYERGHPRFLVGMSGSELANRVIERTGGLYEHLPEYRVEYGAEYWSGSMLCRLQWETARSFRNLRNTGIDLPAVLAMYHPYHEAGPEKFIDFAMERLAENSGGMPRLKFIRKNAGLTQAELARRSGIAIRAIQSYEQGCVDIARAEASTLMRLSRALGCRMSDLIDY